jgi:hypothetical protein
MLVSPWYVFLLLDVQANKKRSKSAAPESLTGIRPTG